MIARSTEAKTAQTSTATTGSKMPFFASVVQMKSQIDKPIIQARNNQSEIAQNRNSSFFSTGYNHQTSTNVGGYESDNQFTTGYSESILFNKPSNVETDKVQRIPFEPESKVDSPDIQAKCATCAHEEEVQRIPFESESTVNTPDIQAKCAACAHEEEVQRIPFESKSTVNTPDIQVKCAACAHEEEVQRIPFESESTVNTPDIQAKCAACAHEKEVQRIPFEPESTVDTPDVQAKCAACAHEEEVQRIPFESECTLNDTPEIQTQCAACTEEDHASASVTDTSVPSIQTQQIATENLVANAVSDTTPTIVQAALLVGTPNDPYEKEADEMAEKVQRKIHIDNTQFAGANDNRIHRSTDLRKRANGTLSTSDQFENRLKMTGSGTPIPDVTRKPLESAFQADFKNVRIHTNTESNTLSQDIGARAFTHRNNIFFNRGEYQPDTPEGQHLLAHELTHTIQQGSSQRTNDLDVPVRRSPNGAIDIQRYSFDDFISDIGIATDAITGAAARLWQTGYEIASAIGSAVHVHGTTLVIDIPPYSGFCPNLAFQLLLPRFETRLPFLVGTLPIKQDAYIYGGLDFVAGITPGFGIELGPCGTLPGKIEIDPIYGRVAAYGGAMAQAAISMQAEVDIGIGGSVGIIILVPFGGGVIPIEIPVVELEAGLAGFASGVAAAEIQLGGAFDIGPSGISLYAFESDTLGLAGDYGLAGYGSLGLLGANICKIYWPLLVGGHELIIQTTRALELSIGSRGAIFNVDIPTPVFNSIAFNTLPHQLRTDFFSDDCPLCNFLDQLDLFPSRYGGDWSKDSHIVPWGKGPLNDVLPKNPHITGGAECRGACGPGCEPPLVTEKEKYVCETLPDGKHRFWLYRNYSENGTHQGCRDHDGCYDYCEAVAVKHPLINIPCHRWCDIEAMCNYGLVTSVGWISGQEPHDGKMIFSDEPEIIGECEGPCPTHPNPGKERKFRMCLPAPIQLFAPRSAAKQLFNKYIRKTVYNEGITVELPGLDDLLSFSLFRVFVEGGISSDIFGMVGPGLLEDVCVEFYPDTRNYKAEATLSVAANAGINVKAWGIIGAKVLELTCLMNALEAEGKLELTGFARFPTKLSDTISLESNKLGCSGDGLLALTNTLQLKACLQLGYSLDASLTAVILKHWTVLTKYWNLKHSQWEKCWNYKVDVFSLGKGNNINPGSQNGGNAAERGDFTDEIQPWGKDKIERFIDWLISPQHEIDKPQPKIALANAHTNLPPQSVNNAGTINLPKNPCKKDKDNTACKDKDGNPQLPDGSWECPIPIRWTKTGHHNPIVLSPLLARWGKNNPIDKTPKTANMNGETKLEIPPTQVPSFEKDKVNKVSMEKINGREIWFVIIGVDSKFMFRKGKIIKRKSGEREGELGRFKTLLANYNYDWKNYSPDHVHDIGFYGPDQFSNLWPLQGLYLNQYQANKVYNQIVQYLDNGQPKEGTVKQLKEKWFIIESIGDIK